MAESLLRRHVIGRAQQRAQAREAPAFGRRCEPEIHHGNPAVRLDHDVLRLQIAMDDALFVGGVETETNLPQYSRDLFRRKSVRSDDLVERLALDKLHGEKTEPPRRSEIVNTHYVAMGNAATNIDLALKALQNLALRR